MHVVPKRGREQTDTIAALAEDAIGLLEHRHPGPLQIARIDRYVLLLGFYLQPVIETADHDGAHRSHAFDLLAFALPLPQAAFHGFRHRNTLGQRKTNGRIDADAAVGGFLDRGNPGARHRDLDDHIGREPVEFLYLLHDSLGIAIQPRIRLYRKPSVTAALRFENRPQQVCTFDGDFTNQLPRDCILSSRRQFFHERVDALLPEAHLLLQDPVYDDRITRGSHRSVLHRIRQFRD